MFTFEFFLMCQFFEVMSFLITINGHFHVLIVPWLTVNTCGFVHELFEQFDLHFKVNIVKLLVPATSFTYIHYLWI